ncbi:MAG: ABC transporter substrate binding protein, partial [Methanothrix sp.]
MKWDDSIISEIKHQFSIYMPSAVINVEFMDTKRIDPNAARLADLKTLYLKKYKDRHFDAIISTDTDAFQFLLNNSEEIFPGTPVVFCGVINFEDEMLRGKRNFTGVMEVFDIRDTISLMLKLHPHTKLIAILNDNTTTGQANRKIVDTVIPEFDNNVSFEYLDNLTTTELMQRVSSLPNDSLILEMTFNRDRAGKILTYEDATSLIQGASSVPIYALRDFHMGYGVVGGKMITGSSQGSEAAKLALRILGGESAEN